MKHRLNTKLIDNVAVVCKSGSTKNYLWLEVYWHDREIGTASFDLEAYKIFDVICYDAEPLYLEVLKQLFCKERTNLIDWIHSL